MIPSERTAGQQEQLILDALERGRASRAEQLALLIKMSGTRNEAQGAADGIDPQTRPVDGPNPK